MESSRKEKVGIYLIFFVFIFSIIILKPLSDLDEIWNFNTARNIANGLIPYKDISMIVTPLMPMVAAIAMKILGCELIVTRILASILGATILYLAYRILEIVSKELNISIIAVLVITIIYRDLFCLDYNFLLLFLALLVLEMDIKKNQEKKESEHKEKNKEILFDFKIGIIAGLAICTKQTIGAIFALASVIYPFIDITGIDVTNKKEKIQKGVKRAFARICGAIIPVRNFCNIFNNNRGIWRIYKLCNKRSKDIFKFN